ncbi:hypothetical protein BLNAU_19747 [Blattamonas nauphoetae]|uniref:Uncharacterized protein n=1 Tax=Blattamonas nauphoetae TaxID=2049346 RepID=A0ABQ9X0L7_9EUKA|nr:hypothetical protein BLNAU_19747 [Blattamonas nauphoetae]
MLLLECWKLTSTPAPADTTSSSLALSSTTINIFNLNGFYTTALFAVPANALSIAIASLSSPVIGISKMSTPIVVLSGGTMTLSNVSLNGDLLTSNFEYYTLKQTAASLLLNKCTFSSITTSDEGAAIQLSLGTDEKLSLTGVAFTSCSSTADASTSFVGCSAANGGAITIDLTGRSDPGTFTLSGVTYGTPQNTVMTKGSDIFVLTASGGRTFLTAVRFGNSQPTTPSSGTFFGTADLNKCDVSVSTAITSTSTVEWKSDTTRRTITLSADVGGSLSVKSSEFSSIESRGAGSAIKAVLNTGQTLLLSDVAFIYYSSHTDGGALHVTNSFILDAALTMAHAHSITSNVILWSSTTNLPITVTAGTFTIPSGTLTLKSLGFTRQNTNMASSFVTVSGTGWTGGVISVALTTLHYTVDGIASFSGCPPVKGGAIVVDLTSSAETVTFTLSKSMGDSVLAEGSILTLNDGNRLAHSTTSNANDAGIVLLSDVSVLSAIASTLTVKYESDSTYRTITLSAVEFGSSSQTSYSTPLISVTGGTLHTCFDVDAASIGETRTYLNEREGALASIGGGCVLLEM